MNDAELLRYSRQIMLPQFDVRGQEALLDARVLIVGLGGLGSAAALYLAAAGVGHLTLADGDCVDESNLQRQIIHQQDQVGVPKVKSAADRIRALNPACRVTRIGEYLSGEILVDAVSKTELVVDATDNFAARQALNEQCLGYRRPMVFASAIRMEGQVSVFDFSSPESPCYRCLYGETLDVDEACSESGVLAPVVGIIGALQAMEAIKVLVGMGRSLTGRLLVLDALPMTWREFRFRRRKDCIACSVDATTDRDGNGGWIAGQAR